MKYVYHYFLKIAFTLAISFCKMVAKHFTILLKAVIFLPNLKIMLFLLLEVGSTSIRQILDFWFKQNILLSDILD